LGLDECKKIIDGLLSFSSPTVILTGGELTKTDIMDIIEYGQTKV